MGWWAEGMCGVGWRAESVCGVGLPSSLSYWVQKGWGERRREAAVCLGNGGGVTRLDHRQGGTFLLLRAACVTTCEGPTNVLPSARITACSRWEAQFNCSGVSDSL